MEGTNGILCGADPELCHADRHYVMVLRQRKETQLTLIKIDQQAFQI